MRDETQLGHVHLDHRSLRDHAQSRIHRALRVLLHTQDVQAERGLEFWVSDVSFLESETRGANEALVLGRLTSERVRHECHLVDHTLPRLLLSLASAKYLEHLVFSKCSDLFDGDLPLASLFLTLLLDHIREDLGAVNFITVQQIGRNSTLFNLLGGVHSSLLLFMCLDILLHLDLLLVALLGVEFSLESVQALRLLGDDLDTPRLLLPLLLIVIEALSETLLMQLHVVVLGLIPSC